MDSPTKKPRKDGGLQRAQQELRKRWQDMRIASTHQEDFFAVDNLGAVVGAEEEAVESISGNEGKIDQAWVNVKGGLRVCSGHSEEWSPRNEALLEAVLKRSRTTKHPWLIAYDVDISP